MIERHFQVVGTFLETPGAVDFFNTQAEILTTVLKNKNGHIDTIVKQLKTSLSMKILSINNFTTKLLSKLLSDLYIEVLRSLVVKLLVDNFFIERLFFI